jgi:hypothetical protein
MNLGVEANMSERTSKESKNSGPSSKEKTTRDCGGFESHEFPVEGENVFLCRDKYLRTSIMVNE